MACAQRCALMRWQLRTPGRSYSSRMVSTRQAFQLQQASVPEVVHHWTLTVCEPAVTVAMV